MCKIKIKYSIQQQNKLHFKISFGTFAIFVFVHNAGFCGINFYGDDNNQNIHLFIRHHYLPNIINSYV